MFLVEGRPYPFSPPSFSFATSPQTPTSSRGRDLSTKTDPFRDLQIQGQTPGPDSFDKNQNFLLIFSLFFIFCQFDDTSE